MPDRVHREEYILHHLLNVRLTAVTLHGEQPQGGGYFLEKMPIGFTVTILHASH